MKIFDIPIEIEKCNRKQIEILLKNKFSFDQYNVLEHAMICKDFYLIKLLITKGDKNQINISHVFEKSIWFGDLEVVKFIYGLSKLDKRKFKKVAEEADRKEILKYLEEESGKY